MMQKVNKDEFSVALNRRQKSRRPLSFTHRHLTRNVLCPPRALVNVHSVFVTVCESIFEPNVCMMHFASLPSISFSFSPQLFHLPSFLKQSANSLSCQSKPTFMQTIMNDTIHLAWAPSLSSALIFFHPFSLDGLLRSRLPSNVP